MEHEKAIALQRIENLHNGVIQAERYVAAVNRMLLDVDIDKEAIKAELHEIRDYLLWLSTL